MLYICTLNHNNRKVKAPARVVVVPLLLQYVVVPIFQRDCLGNERRVRCDASESHTPQLGNLFAIFSTRGTNAAPNQNVRKRVFFSSSSGAF